MNKEVQDKKTVYKKKMKNCKILTALGFAGICVSTVASIVTAVAAPAFMLGLGLGCFGVMLGSTILMGVSYGRQSYLRKEMLDYERQKEGKKTLADSFDQQDDYVSVELKNSPYNNKYCVKKFIDPHYHHDDHDMTM